MKRKGLCIQSLSYISKAFAAKKNIEHLALDLEWVDVSQKVLYNLILSLRGSKLPKTCQTATIM